MDYTSLCCSTLGRIIKVSPEVLAYRDWTIKKWGAKQYAKLENHGNFVATLGLHLRVVTFRLELYFVMAPEK